MRLGDVCAEELCQEVDPIPGEAHMQDRLTMSRATETASSTEYSSMESVCDRVSGRRFARR